MRYAVLMVALAIGSGGTAQTAGKSKYPALALEGKPAPAFTADFALNGPTAAPADLKGKVVLLDFWAVWCGPCRALFPELRRLHQTYHKKGLEVVGVTRYYRRYEFKAGKLTRARDELASQGEQTMLQAFAAHHKLPYRILTSDGALAAYEVTAIPTLFLIDRKGVVRRVSVGPGPAAAKALEPRIRALLNEK